MAFALFLISSTSLSLPLSPSPLSLTLTYHELLRLFYVHYQESDTYLNRIAISFASDVWIALFTNERTSVFLMLVDFLPKVLNHVGGALLYTGKSQASTLCAHNLLTIILHQLCSKGTQLTIEQARSLKMML